MKLLTKLMCFYRFPFLDKRSYLSLFFFIIFSIGMQAQSAALSFTDKTTGQTTSGWTAASAGTKLLNVQSQDAALLLNGKDSWEISYTLTINSSDFNQWGCPLFVADHSDATRGDFTGSIQIWWQGGGTGNPNELLTKVNSATISKINNTAGSCILAHTSGTKLDVKVTFTNSVVNNLQMEIKANGNVFTRNIKLCETELPVSAIQFGYATGWVVSGLTGKVTKADNSGAGTSGIFPEWEPTVSYSDAVNPDWQSAVPKLIYPDNNLVKLYNTAWKIASTRVRRGPAGIPASPYMDESCYDDQIWIWDSGFMSMFCKYAPSAFPGVQTLEDLYYPIHKNVATGLKIHLRDNPPVLAWAEYDNYMFTGDEARMKHVMDDENFLEKHFNFFNTVAKGSTQPNVSAQGIYRGQVRKNSAENFVLEGESGYDQNGQLVGFTWTGGASGMDNTPRGRDAGGYDKIMWVDAMAQQALSALYIARIHDMRGNKTKAAEWMAKYNEIKTIINTLYWDETDGFYYDVIRSTKKTSKVRSSTAFWVMMAEVAPADRAARMIKYLQTDNTGFSDLGGKYPWISLSRRDQDFNAATGDYWKGGIWMPLVYMGTKALEKYGYSDLADELANNVVQQILRTYMNGFECKNTIWECYSPSTDRPSTEYGKTARPDFCGWTALGPTSLVIENVLGFYKVDAVNDSVFWRLRKSNGLHGIENLKFSNTTTKILYDPATDIVSVTTDKAYVLDINGKRYNVPVGSNTIDLKSTDTDKLSQQSNSLTIRLEDGLLCVKSPIATRLDIFTVDGKLTQSVDIVAGENKISGLCKGMYLIKSKGIETIKVRL